MGLSQCSCGFQPIPTSTHNPTHWDWRRGSKPMFMRVSCGAHSFSQLRLRLLLSWYSSTPLQNSWNSRPHSAGVDWDARKGRHTGASMRPLPFALLPCNLPSPRIRRCPYSQLYGRARVVPEIPHAIKSIPEARSTALPTLPPRSIPLNKRSLPPLSSAS